MQQRTGVGLLNAHLFVVLLREIQTRGVDATPLLRCCDLRMEQLTAFGAGVPSHQGLRLLRLLSEGTDEPAIGLQAGTKAVMSDLDLAGMMLRASADVPSALDLFTRMMETAGSVYCTEIVQSRDGVIVRYLPPMGEATPRVLHDLFLSVVRTLASEVLGPFLPSDVHVAQPRGEYAGEYERLFGVPVRFDAPWTQLTVPITVAERFTHSDTTLVRVIEPHVERAFAGVNHVHDLRSQVQHVLMTELRPTPLSITQVAERLGVNTRTLRRRLQAEHTSFQQILDQTRHEVALRFLGENPRASGAQLAEVLGYREPPAFYRAFKRWTGVPLTQYRAPSALTR